jgi:hypothetical protein
MQGIFKVKMKIVLLILMKIIFRIGQPSFLKLYIQKIRIKIEQLLNREFKECIWFYLDNMIAYGVAWKELPIIYCN